MAKPIALIYLPNDFQGFPDREWIYQFMSSLNGDNGKWGLGMKTNDYIWFCFYKEGITEPELQVFHEKNWTDIQQAELKELILNSLPKTT